MGAPTKIAGTNYATLGSGETLPITVPVDSVGNLGTPVSGGGGGAATIADGADVALGTTTDAPVDVVEDGTARTGISLLKGIKNYLRRQVFGPGTEAAALRVTLPTDGTGVVGASGIKVTAATMPTGGVGFLGWLTAIANYLAGILTVKIDQTTPKTTNKVFLQDIGQGEYETVAASQTGQVLGATGAIGDYLAGILIIPATTSPGVVTILDGATSITIFTGGATSVSNLVPFMVPLGIYAVGAGWSVTTGANVSAIGSGNFS